MKKNPLKIIQTTEPIMNKNIEYIEVDGEFDFQTEEQNRVISLISEITKYGKLGK